MEARLCDIPPGTIFTFVEPNPVGYCEYLKMTGNYALNLSSWLEVNFNLRQNNEVKVLGKIMCKKPDTIIAELEPSPSSLQLRLDTPEGLVDLVFTGRKEMEKFVAGQHRETFDSLLRFHAGSKYFVE